MIHRPECLPCCLRRVLHAADKATTDEWLPRRVLVDTMRQLTRADEKSTPAELIHSISRRAGKTLGTADPFAEEKRLWLDEILSNAESIRSRVRESQDPFQAALQLSLAANILDSEFRGEFVRGFGLRLLVEGFREVPFATDNVEDLRLALASSRNLLLVHCTAGELFFDRLLIEAAGKPREQVVSVVRAAPILAHATREDAERAGLPEVATVIDTGNDVLGLPLSACSEELREAYRASDLVLAKGQAAFETLQGKQSQIDGESRDVYFLLRAKCALIARYLGVSVGDSVLEVET